MSHFWVIALVPGDIPEGEVEGYISFKMEPYSESIEVDEHPEECYCVGREALYAARKAVDNAVAKGLLPSVEDLRAKYHLLPEDKRTDALWESWIRPHKDLQEKALRSHPRYGKPDPACEECGGTGKRMTTYNPQSKWDWWRIGGRWDGEIFGTACASEDGGFNFSPDHETLEHNLRTVEDLLGDDEPPLPFALLTPDGEWIEKGEMGWFGMVKDEEGDAAWEAQVLLLYERHRDCVAVTLDCHI